MKPEHYYFAYGSNMNIAQMKERCPRALDLGAAILRNHCLRERGTADVDFEPGNIVYGVLYQLTDADLARLDGSEGHPSCYRREMVDVENDGMIYRAWVYKMSERTRHDRGGKTYEEYNDPKGRDYRGICAVGANEHGIPDQFSISAPVALIVYGTLMSGECNHYLCRNAICIEPCTISGTLYDTGYGYPAFEPEIDGEPVRAEYIQIPYEDWEAIDHLEGYPHLYDRRRCAATLDDGSTVFGWVYIMKSLPECAEIINSGDWKQRF